MKDVEAALGQGTVIARTDDQIPRAGAAIGSGQADVGDPLEPHVIDGAEDPGRRFD